MSDDIILKIEDLSHSFGEKHVLHDIDLEIRRGEFVALVGPSGCGKSTLLNAIYGTLKPTKGRVIAYSNGTQPFVITRPTRHCGMVDQQYRLFINRTALRNVSIGPKLDETSIPFRLFKPFEWKKIREAQHERAKKMLERVGLGNEADSYPSELSGGMRQRVAIAQTLIMKPTILLLDEPFGALDEATRESLQHFLLSMYAENQYAKQMGKNPPHTVFIVTHELYEAIYVADRVIGLSQHWDWKKRGYLEHPGATILYDEPAPVFSPNDPRDFHTYSAMKNNVYRLVIDKETCKAREDYLSMLIELRSERRNGGSKL